MSTGVIPRATDNVRKPEKRRAACGAGTGPERNSGARWRNGHDDPGALGLDEQGYRGARFDALYEGGRAGEVCRGNNGLCTQFKPAGLGAQHSLAYFRAGADIVFCDQYVLLDPHRTGRLRHGGDRLRAQSRRRPARAQAATEVPEKEDGRPRFVAGAIGPTNRTASISPDVTIPAFRAITFDELRVAYAEQVRGLVEGGVDILLIETIFDSSMPRRRSSHCTKTLRRARRRLPVMISGTITDRSGRLLSGQTPEAFWNSIAHAAAVRGSA